MNGEHGRRRTLGGDDAVTLRVVGIDATTVLGPGEESTISGRVSGRSITFDERFKGWAGGRVDHRSVAGDGEVMVLTLVDPSGETGPEVAGEIAEWSTMGE